MDQLFSTVSHFAVMAGQLVVSALIPVAFLAVGSLSVWAIHGAHTKPQPAIVYDPRVRVNPDRSFQYIVVGIFSVWLGIHWWINAPMILEGVAGSTATGLQMFFDGLGAALSWLASTLPKFG